LDVLVGNDAVRTPFDAHLSKVEAALKALGSSPTRAQVLGATAPLGPALAPIETLLAAPLPTILEAPWAPAGTVGNDGTYRTTGQGARYDVGGKPYPSGFQVDLLSFATLVWPTRKRYKSLSAELGEDGLDTNTGVEVKISLDDSTNTSIPFFDGGKLVYQARVLTRSFISLNVPLAHLSKLKMLFIVGVAGGGVVDVVNDRLS
jgi:hypothetical protein